MKKIFLILFGIFFALLIIEINLQIAGLTVKKIRDYKHNHQINTDYKSIKNKKTITIMCVGESTTDGQYPLFLEEYLSKYIPDKKFNVIDSGYGGIRLDELYYHIETNIAKYKPDIIVGMIGINDTTEYVFKIMSQKLKIIRLFHLFFYSYEKENIEKQSNAKHKTKYYQFSHEKAEKIKNTLSYLLFNQDINYQNSLFSLLSKTTENEATCIYGLENELFAMLISKYYEYHYIKTDNLTFNKIVNNIIKNEIIAKDFRYGLKGIICMINSDYKNGIKNLNAADFIRINYDYTDISKKYKKILDLIIKKNNIKYIAMQYPVRDVGSLKKIIENTGYYNNVVFVSNKENFRKILISDAKKHIFNDLFAWDFGHCTELGNRLIADNLANEISRYLIRGEL